MNLTKFRAAFADVAIQMELSPFCTVQNVNSNFLGLGTGGNRVSSLLFEGHGITQQYKFLCVLLLSQLVPLAHFL